MVHSRMPERRSAASALLVRFRRQRPLRAGSLIVTVFGDAIAPRGGAITLGSLIRLVAPFGLTERLVRTSVARLAADGWLTNRRVGRLSEYHLSSIGRQRFSEATRRIYAGPASQWAGRWTLMLLSALEPARRRGLREQLRWEGFGELRPGLLAHPTLSPAEAREHAVASGAGNDLILLEARAASSNSERRLVESGWDLSDLAARYERFLQAFRPVLGSVGRSLPPVDAFCVRTLLIHEYRKVHLRDPLLPQSLLPADWPGFAAYDVCRQIYARVLDAAEGHLSSVAARLDGALPDADTSLFERFAGLPR